MAEKQDPSLGQQAIAAAAGVVPGLLSRLLSDPNSTVPPELRQLLGQSVERTNYQNPLFQAVTNQAFQGLPTYARQGLSLSGSLSSPQSPAQSGGGGMSPLLAGALGAGGGALASNPGSLNGIINALKKLFGGGGRDTVQGNQPNSGGALTGPSAYNPTSFMGWGDLMGSDPTAGYGPMMAASDPSGGTGIGPGMQAYYDSLGGAEDPQRTGTDWWNE